MKNKEQGIVELGQLQWYKNKNEQLLRFHCPLHNKRHNHNSFQGQICLNKLKVDIGIIKMNEEQKK